ncbi:PIN domain-containing protein [Zunongwangia sp. F260]|uniref:PIN domain-containing protein n=1 Tax=Autumnicola lenta TaxID=3075593 RepID=A0ABU3CIG8_9FLAO|nr:PIN domain-containing protein [Zunongwangia sp. F260]MDT0646091.1 PIN domain-containing protein [Zunongwangia sp. F260]
MSNLFVDTNIVIDLLAKREPFCQPAGRLFSLADQGKLDLTISSLSFANTNYVLSRLKSAKEARRILRKFKVLVELLPLNDKIVELALNDENFADYEDALQYYTALEFNQTIIISRNLKDFKSAEIPVMTADQYLIHRKSSQ